MRICLVYDCIYPHTVGGAERLYANLARRLASDGHEVTYLTLRHWRHEPGLPETEVVAVGPRLELYVGGRRRILPPLVFGIGVAAHLLRHGGRYDIVHTAAFPYFSLLAAALVRPLRRYRLIVDWHEVWTRDYWREYLGPVAGRAGAAVQKLCLRVPQRAFCLSRLHADRLRSEGVNGPVVVLEGAYDGDPDAPSSPAAAEPVAVFAGRHIPEKRVRALVDALPVARRRLPELRCEIYGDGPERPAVLRAIGAHGLEGVVTAPGFVDEQVVQAAFAKALCLVLPSRREGYGLVVIEAAARGTPCVVVAGPDNAAAELVSDGENGCIAVSASPEDLAEAIVRVHAGGQALRESTLAWFKRNADRLSLRRSLETVAASYSG